LSACGGIFHIRSYKQPLQSSIVHIRPLPVTWDRLGNA
jgi:hypothetical protein